MLSFYQIINKLYHPPFGIYGPVLNNYIRQQAIKILPVSFYASDADYGPSKINTVVKNTIESITYLNGGIIVLHDGKDIHSDLLNSNDPKSKYNRSWIPDAADFIISNLLNKGFHFALLD